MAGSRSSKYQNAPPARTATAARRAIRVGIRMHQLRCGSGAVSLRRSEAPPHHPPGGVEDDLEEHRLLLVLGVDVDDAQVALRRVLDLRHRLERAVHRG